MITRNFRELLGMTLGASTARLALRPVKDVTGRMYYASPSFYFPAKDLAENVTLDPVKAGISVGRGTSPENENDYNLAETITEGATLTLTGKNVGCDAPGDPWVEYYITVTNTGSEPLTVTEVGYKQWMYGCVKLGYPWSSSAYKDILALLDRTVLEVPMVVEAGDAGVIIYKLKTKLHERRVAGVRMVDFAYGSDEELSAMIDAARLGSIDLQSDGGWRVGDQRRIHLDAWTGGDGVAHESADLLIAITSFEEYGGCGNLFQFDFLESDGVGQRMNPTDTTAGGYGATEMYTVTLPAMAAALPAWLRSRLRSFPVDETVENNRLALRSWGEIFDSETPPAYYHFSDQRVKTLPGSLSTTSWWMRTPQSSANFYRFTDGGNNRAAAASSLNAVAPFGCV